MQTIKSLINKIFYREEEVRKYFCDFCNNEVPFEKLILTGKKYGMVYYFCGNCFEKYAERYPEIKEDV